MAERDYTKLSENLLLQIDTLLMSWLPDGKRTGHEWVALNPTRADRKLGSFSVNLHTGQWADFAMGESGGNLITLYSMLNGCKNSESYDALSDDTNIQNYTQNTYVPKIKNNIDEWKILPLPDVIPNGEHYQLGFPTERYIYDDFIIFRYKKEDGTKDIRPMTFRQNINTNEISWKWKAKGENRSLFNRHLINDKPILIVEGEKAGSVVVDGYTVVSWAGGSNAIKKTNWDELKNRGDVSFWADRDEAGHKTIGILQEILPYLQIVPIDFSIGDGQDIADISKKEIQQKLKFLIKSIDRKEDVPIQDEIIIPYNTKYPNIKPIKKGVIIARTGSGKTFQFEGKPDTLILVPRVLQTTVYTGESLDFLFNKIAIDGAIITYDKFYGHYRSSEEFKSAIDHNKITLVVDEAHMLVSRPSRMNRTIYELDAVFMSGTLEKFFRRDLQRYKYKPVSPEQMYYTNGVLPRVEGSLVFVDNAKALIHNYPNNCIVSKEHKHNNVNVHTTDLSFIFSTSALREGISINNGNFVACMAYMQACQLWSMKDTIQGLHRVRGENILRVVSKEPPETYDKYIDVDWWMKFVKENSEDDKCMNAVFGEHYSKLIKTTHKVNNYTEPSEYGVICYLAEKTKHNFDKDFYVFNEYNEDYEPLKIDLDTSGVVVEENGMLRYTMSNGTRYEFPEKIRDRFMKWVPQVESGLVSKMMKMKEFKNFKEIYNRSNIGQTIRKNYNSIHKGHGKKYSIDMFYSLVRELV